MPCSVSVRNALAAACLCMEVRAGLVGSFIMDTSQDGGKPSRTAVLSPNFLGSTGNLAFPGVRESPTLHLHLSALLFLSTTFLLSGKPFFFEPTPGS